MASTSGVANADPGAADCPPSCCSGSASEWPATRNGQNFMTPPTPAAGRARPSAHVEMGPLLQHFGSRPQRRFEMLLVGAPHALAHVLEIRELAQDLREARVSLAVQTELVRADSLEIRDVAPQLLVGDVVQLDAPQHGQRKVRMV